MRQLSYLFWTVIVVSLAVLVSVAEPTRAQADIDQQAVMDPFAYEVITVSTTAIGFTAATIAPSGTVSARKAECSIETAALRFRYSGDPTASDGHAKAADTTFTVYGTNGLRLFRMIRSGGTNATVRCSYFR